MVIQYTEDGQKLGRESDLVPKYEIRSRTQGGKPFYVMDLTITQKQKQRVFEARTRRACIEFCIGYVDIGRLASSHNWGMKRYCKYCNALKPLSRFRLNHRTYKSNWRSKCMDCDALRKRKERADKRKEVKSVVDYIL